MGIWAGGGMSGVIVSWHAYIESRDPDALLALLDEEVVFESPVVLMPQRGKAVTLQYLAAAAEVLGGPDFAYLNEWQGADSAILEFETRIDGIWVNGVDMIWWNAAGRITRFKVMVRPLKAINLLHQLMAARLSSPT